MATYSKLMNNQTHLSNRWLYNCILQRLFNHQRPQRKEKAGGYSWNYSVSSPITHCSSVHPSTVCLWGLIQLLWPRWTLDMGQHSLLKLQLWNPRLHSSHVFFRNAPLPPDMRSALTYNDMIISVNQFWGEANLIQGQWSRSWLGRHIVSESMLW